MIKITQNKIIAKVMLFVLFSLCSLSIIAEELPIRLQVALMSKIVAMEQNLAKKEELSIYILGASKIYDLMKNDIGFKIGNSTLAVLEQGNTLPQKKYDVIYIGDFSLEAAAVEYAERYDVMSLYPIIVGMKKTGSLGLGIKSGKPRFLLDLEQSEAENLRWNAKILKVAQLK